MAKVAMLGSGFIARFYTRSLHAQRSRDQVHIVYARKAETGQKFAAEFNIPEHTTDLAAAINHPDVDAVVIALPNNLHLQAVLLAAQAGKAVLCTKPLGCSGDEARQMLDAVEQAGVFHGYLEDLAYTPKTLEALNAVQSGAVGKVLWTRSRETHPGPHSDWFWDINQSGGGAILDLACHCIEVSRNYIGKNVRPVEVMCWADTLVKPIEAEDHAIGLVKYETGAIAQFEVSWAFRGGMDLRDELTGTEGTIRIDHFLRTGFELFTAVGRGGYVAEKAETEIGWLFPVGDEVHDLGYTHMFTDMFNALENGKTPMESFYDGYVVNAVMDACLKSAKTRQWEPVMLDVWRGNAEAAEKENLKVEFDADHWLIKEELVPGGDIKRILKHKQSGQIVQQVLAGKK